MPDRYALLIGNSNFRHKQLERLSAPANDVCQLADLLKDPAIGGFTTELKLDIGLVDARRAIKRLFEDRHPDDLVLFYYSGHGLLDTRGRFYLAMTETDPTDPDAGSIDETWLRGVFDGSLSARQVAILDCCHSGGFIPGDPMRKDASAGPILTEKTFDPTGHGRFIMAATTAATSAFEQEGRSLYTRHLVEGLTGGAAAPESNAVTVLDLHDFVKRRVAETAPASMRPQIWRDASLNPDAHHLTIARNPHPRPKLPDEEVAKLWSKDMQAVELAIYQLMEVAQGDDTLAEDARKVLRERLNASDSLPYTLGARIAAFVSDVPTPAEFAQFKAEMEADIASAIEERDAARNELDHALGVATHSERARSRTRTILIVVLCLASIAGVSALLRIGALELELEERAAVSIGGEAGRSSDRCTLSPVDRCTPGSWFVERNGFPKMVVIPAGDFTMGSPESEDDRSSRESPQQDLSIGRFALAQSEVTFTQWEACVADGRCTSIPTPNDREGGRGSRPVIEVSWNHAQEFVAWLNSKVEGSPYRLPSEAEWEYAARAGEAAAYPWGPTWIAAQANGANAVGQTRKVGSFPANAFGLVDMIGNVWEWTKDCWRDNLRGQPADGAAVTEGLGADCTRRVVRGGAWNLGPRFLRSAFRGGYVPLYRSDNLGFRPARTLTP